MKKIINEIDLENRIARKVYSVFDQYLEASEEEWELIREEIQNDFYKCFAETILELFHQKLKEK